MANPEMWDGSALKGDKPKRKGTRSKPIAFKSEHGTERYFFLLGVLARALKDQEARPGFAHHGYTCETCHKVFEGTLEEVLFELQAGHIAGYERFRGSGFRYSQRKVGVDLHIRPQCAACNQKQDRERQRKAPKEKAPGEGA